VIENGPKKLPNDSDPELELALWLENAGSGDNYILDILTKHYAGEIYRLFLALIDTGGDEGFLHNQVLTHTERVFLHAVQNLDSFQGHDSVRSWLITIAINFFNSNRILKFQTPIRKQSQSQETYTKPITKNLSGQDEAIIAIINQTDTISRTAVILKYAHKLKANRIAQILKIRIPQLIKTIKDFRSIVEEVFESEGYITRHTEDAHQNIFSWIELSLDGLFSDDPVGSKKLSQHLLTCTACRNYHQHLSRLESTISKAFKNRWQEEIFSPDDRKKIIENYKSLPPVKERPISKRNINSESVLLGALLTVVLVFGYFLTKNELPKANPVIYPTLTINPTSLITPFSTPAVSEEFPIEHKPSQVPIINSNPVSVISGSASSSPINRKFVYYREPTLSSGGDFLVFSASFTNITKDGPKFENGLFILNLIKNQIEPPIIFQENSVTDIWSFTPTISKNGRYIAYQNFSGELKTDELNSCIKSADFFSCSDIFLYDRETGINDKVLQKADLNSNRISRILPTLSGDGNWISYWSTFRDDEVGLVNTCGDSVDAFACWNIVLLNLNSNERIVLPVGRSTTRYRTGNIERLSLSENGDLLAFTLHGDDSLAPSLGIINKKEAIIYNRITGEYLAINVSSSGYAGNGLSTHPVLSSDRKYVAFSSMADNIVSGDTNQRPDIFVRDLEAGTISRINVSNDGEQADGDSGVYLHNNEPWKDMLEFSSDRRYIVYLSSAENLDQMNPANCPENSWFPCTNFFIYDLQSSSTEMISTETQRRDRIFTHPSISSNGEKVAYIMSDLDCFQAPQCTHILLYDNVKKTTRSLTDFGLNAIHKYSGTADLKMISDENVSGVTDLEFSPDGALLASASNDKTIRIWSANSKTPQKSYNEHKQLISDISFSPDGKLLASSSLDGEIRIWDLEFDKNRKLNNNSGSVFALDFSLDGTKLAAGGSHTSWVWDLEHDPPSIVHTKSFPDTRINSLAYSPDGELIAFGASDNTIWIMDTDSGEIVSRLGGHEGDTLVVIFSHDSHYLVSGSTDSTVQVWQISDSPVSEKEFFYLFSIQFQDWINDLSISPDGKYIAISSFGSEITFWELQTGKNVNIPLGQRWFQPLSIAFSPQTSGTELAIGSSRGGIELWSFPDLK